MHRAALVWSAGSSRLPSHSLCPAARKLRRCTQLACIAGASARGSCPHRAVYPFWRGGESPWKLHSQEDAVAWGQVRCRRARRSSYVGSRPAKARAVPQAGFDGTSSPHELPQAPLLLALPRDCAEQTHDARLPPSSAHPCAPRSPSPPIKHPPHRRTKHGPCCPEQRAQRIAVPTPPSLAMTSFFGRLRSNAVSCPLPAGAAPTDWLRHHQPPASPSTAVAPAKKDPNAPQPTPLEKLLAADTAPIRSDGSDKFFGYENVRQLHPPPLLKADSSLSASSSEVPGTPPAARRPNLPH